MSRQESAERLPERSDYGSGCYRRCIVVEASGRRVRGELADDFHHFAVNLEHDGRRVVAVRGEAVRVPWATCPGALEPLRRMEGAPLDAAPDALHRFTDPRAQCTHLHDLACLAIAHAARSQTRGEPVRRYDATLPDRVEGRTRATLDRDGRRILDWSIDGTSIAESSPEGFAGWTLAGRDFREQMEGLRDADLVEATRVLQRAVFIGQGRRHDFDAMETAEAFAPTVGAACHTFDPSRIAGALRIVGTVRDFSDAPERILEREGRD